jgi:Domain of Unknown Function (DUF1080)
MRAVPVVGRKRRPQADAKVDVVLRLLRGEPLQGLAEELDVPPQRLLAWRDAFLAAGQARLAQLEDGTARVPATRSIRLGHHRSLPLAWVLAGGGILLALVLVVTLVYQPDIDRGWRVVYDGYGKVGVEETETGEPVHYLSPMRPERPEETHAALKTSTKTYGDLQMALRVRTVRQLRQRSTPNPWETAWVIWHYRDDQHFYYLTLKPNGWEIGKRDPAYRGNQRFLVSDKRPIYYFNTWYDIRVVQVDGTMAVWVNGQPLAHFTDNQSPYTEGHVGLYAEDAYAQFASIKVESANPSALTNPTHGTGTTPTSR